VEDPGLISFLKSLISPMVSHTRLRHQAPSNKNTMQTFIDADFVGRTLYVSTNAKEVAEGLFPVCIHIVKNKKYLTTLLKDLELKGETISSMVWER
jgi:hypothetical protein